MTSLRSKDSEPKTGVLWDVEDCPIPNGLDPVTVSRNIKSALANHGYHAEVEITAYVEKEPIENDFELAGINLKVKGNKYGRHYAIFNDKYKYKWTKGSNLLIISRDKTEFMTYLDEADAKLLFAEPPDPPENCCKCGIVVDKKPVKKWIPKGVIISDEWVWTSLAFGGNPIPKTEEQESGANCDSGSESDSDSGA